MWTLMVAARALHFASLVALAGMFSFLVFVAEPSFRAAALAPKRTHAFRRTASGLIWSSLTIAILSGALWLVMEAQSMSGRPLAEVFSRGIVGTVLARTHFGNDWEWRAFLCLPLLAGAALLPRPKLAPWARWAGLILSAAELGTLAWAGHGGADSGWDGILHAAADVLHLLAAGAWLGGLLPLALLLAVARRDHDRPWAIAADAATARFSILGIASVGTILVSGLINTWYLAGNAPSLFGTDYGQLLLLKIVLFLAMVGIAGVNRARLTPRLAPASPAGPQAIRQLARNALIEAGLGGVILLVVGVLGTLPPGLHTQSWWPFPYALSWSAAQAAPTVRFEVIAALILILGGAGAVAYGLARRPPRWRAAATGGILIVGIVWLPASLLAVPTYPTSFDHSPIAAAAPSIARGAKVFAENCTACHGAGGRGDGPLAKQTRRPPADLTAPHLLSHRVGDLFWWIGHGIDRGGMPAFGDILAENQRWDVINFIRARASGFAARQLPGTVGTRAAPEIPDFVFESQGRQETLRQAIKANPVLLILYRQPDANGRLAQLAASEQELRDGGLRLLAVPINGAPLPAAPDFVVSTSPEALATLALFLDPEEPAHTEYLIDSAGYLRARWQPAGGAVLPDATALLAALAQVKALPLEHAEGHVHAH